MEEFLDVGFGVKTPAKVTIHLKPDGTFVVENHGAGALWCRLHNKWLRFIAGDGPQPDSFAQKLIDDTPIANVIVFNKSGL